MADDKRTPVPETPMHPGLTFKEAMTATLKVMDNPGLSYAGAASEAARDAWVKQQVEAASRFEERRHH